MTEDDLAAEKRTAVECLTFGANTAKRKLRADRGILAAVDSPTADTCPNGDPRCDGPGGVGPECFTCYRAEGSA